MRQPKYKLGETVVIPLELKHSYSGYTKIQKVPGVVIGVSYNPREGTTGWPFYTYRVVPMGASSSIQVDEKGISKEVTNEDTPAL